MAKRVRGADDSHDDVADAKPPSSSADDVENAIDGNAGISHFICTKDSDLVAESDIGFSVAELISEKPYIGMPRKGT